jgi:uncharacterized protein RhaS with RHS repeats
MHGLNRYDFEARPYDPIPGRFLTPDPLAEEYPWINPYAYCSNNPVNYIDPTGMEWKTKEDEEYANKLSQAMTNKATSEQKSLDKLNAKIAKNEAKGKDVSKDQAKAAGMQENIDNLNAGVTELTAMGDTKDQVFTYNMTEGSVGYTSVDDNGVIVMDISGNGSIPNGIHESSHGYDIWQNGGYTKGNYLSGESKAYGRQFSFDSKSIPTSDWYKPIHNSSDINGSYVLGIKNNGEYLYGKIYHGNSYNYKLMQRAFKIAKANQW